MQYAQHTLKKHRGLRMDEELPSSRKEGSPKTADHSNITFVVVLILLLLAEFVYPYVAR